MKRDLHTKAQPQRNPYRTCQTMAAGLLLSASTALAQTLWTGGTGDFNNPASWTGTYIGGSNPNCSNDSGSNNVVLIQPGDPVWQHGDTLAGNGANTSGSYLQTGSTNNTGGGNWLRMGLATGSYGQYVLSNGVVNVGGRIQIGEEGIGCLEISGGSIYANVNDTGANPGLSAGDGSFASVANNFPVGTVVLNSGLINIGNGEVWFGNAGNDINSRGTGHFIMHGGTFNANNWFVFGRFGAAGDGYMDGGVINKNNNGNVQIGVGTMNSGGTGGQGYFTQLGGTFNCGSQYQVGTDAAIAQATNDVGGTAILNVGNWFAVGRNGASGVLNISGSAAITMTGVNGGNVTIGAGGGGSQQTASVGIVDQNGGTFTNTATQTWIGETGQGTWNMNSGSAILGTVILADTASGSGTLNLAGGLFRATSISSPNPGAFTAVNFNGGTLQAGAGNANFISGLSLAYVQAGGAVIDSQGYNIGIPQVLTDGGGGGLTKLGSGTLTLSGANNYSGNTTISGGALITTTASLTPGNVFLADGTGFGISVLSAGAQYSASNLTLGNSSGGNTLDFAMGNFGNPSPTQAPINLTGALSNLGVTTVNVADDFPQVGQFPLIKYASMGAGNGSFVVGSLPTGVVASIVTNSGNSSIDLLISSVNQPRWDGQAGATWDTGADTNWVNIGTGLPTSYTDPSLVQFDDNAQGSTTVNLTTTVHPLGVTVTNNALSYTIVGTGKISGSAGIRMEGTNMLAILNTGGNDFTNPVVISAGTVGVTNLPNDGVAGPLGKGSLVLAGGNLSYSGPPESVGRSYTTTAGSSTLTTVNSLTLTNGTLTAGPGGGMSKAGLAKLTYALAGTSVHAEGSSGGYDVLDGSVIFDGSNGAQTNVIGGSRLGLNGQNSIATVLVTNSILNITNGNIDLGNLGNSTNAMTIDGNSTVTLGSWLIFGDGGNVTSTLNLNNGTLNVNSGKILMGGRPGDTSTLNINAGFLNNAGGQAFDIADGGWNGPGDRTATVNQSGGTNNCNNGMSVGNAFGGTGFYNLTNGEVDLSGEIDVGNGGGVGTVTIAGGTINANNWFTVGRSGSVGCVLNMSGGTINKNSNGSFIIGTGAGNQSLIESATFNISGGTVNSAGEFWLAEDNGATATNNISGTASVNIHDWVTVGRQGIGVVNMTGGQFNSDTQPFVVGIWGGSQGIWNQSAGSLSVNNELWIAQGDPTALGTINLNGGTITNTSWLAVGREGGSGVFNINGGTYVRSGPGGGPNGPNVSIAHGGGTGTVNVNSGYVDVSAGDTWVGEDSNTGMWNMNGGTAKLAYVQLARNANANGVMALNGGSLTATEITTGNTGATQRELDLNGGTLVAGTDNANFIHDLSAVNVQAGGAVINSAGHNVSINQPLLDAGGGGGLTKLGTGTVYLSGVNTYSGPTLVNAGTLGGSGSIAGSVTVAAGATLAPGAPVGTLAVNNNVTLGGSLAIALSKNGGVPASGLLAVTGNLGCGGTLNVVVTGTNALAFNDTVTLLSWGTRSGSFSGVTLPAGYLWDSSQLLVNGTIRVIGVTPPAVSSSRVANGKLVVTGVGGPAGSGYTWLTSTNAAAPLSTWTTNTTGVFDSNAAFSNALPINVSEPARFFRLRTP